MSMLDVLVDTFFPPGYENMTEEERAELMKFPADKT